jgi:VanZ family protein
VQGFLPHRSAELADLLVNLVAVTVGLVAVAVWRVRTDR